MVAGTETGGGEEGGAEDEGAEEDVGGGGGRATRGKPGGNEELLP